MMNSLNSQLLTKYWAYILIAMILSFLFTACNSTSLAAQTPTNGEIGESTPTVRPTQPRATVPATATNTEQPQTPSPSPTVHNTETPTPQPSLSSEEANEYIQVLFHEASNCLLPCWWGITPGVSRWHEANRLIDFVGGNTSPKAMQDQFISHSFQGINLLTENGTVTNYFEFWERNEIVELIWLNSYGFNDPPAFQNLWKNYSPRQIMIEYGTPTRIWLQSESSGPSGSNRRAGYYLWLFYDNDGFLIIYTGATAFEPVYHFCPEFHGEGQLEAIDVYLQSAENPSPIEENAQMMGLEINPFPSIQTIEEATEISVDQFYNLFTSAEPPTCFDTPQGIWP